MGGAGNVDAGELVGATVGFTDGDGVGGAVGCGVGVATGFAAGVVVDSDGRGGVGLAMIGDVGLVVGTRVGWTTGGVGLAIGCVTGVGG